MTETQQLLGKIAALRQRLDQAQGLASEAGTAMASLFGGDGDSLVDLRRHVEAGAAHDHALDAALRPLEPAGGAAPMPRLLTARARMLAERGRELLVRLRGLNDILSPDLPESRTDPRGIVYRQTVALATTALRALAFLPDTVTAQLPLCEGPSAILDVVMARLRTLETTVHAEEADQTRLRLLAYWLRRVEQGDSVDLEPFITLANDLINQAEECLPLRFFDVDGDDPDQIVAAHSLNVASVVARVASHASAFRQRVIEPVIAALLMDVGMLRLPLELLTTSEPQTPEQRRKIEAHTREGEELILALQPDSTWLAQAVLQHHERLDGTGYPDGSNEYQLDPVARLLAVCDVYVTLASRRPDRPACEPRTAMTDTLLLADQGLLDREFAEALLHLSFYPVGTIVELADGAIGVVAAVPGSGSDLTNPSRPVVLLLLEASGTPLAIPRHLDLSQIEGHSIQRSLPTPERKQRLGRHFPEWA